MSEYDRLYYKQNAEKLKARKRRYYREHPEKVRAIGVKAAQKRKYAVMFHYSTGTLSCSRCGIDDMDCLCIDHINDDGSEQRRKYNQGAGSRLYSWLIKYNYPKGYQVLCANCNLKKRLQGLRRI